MKEVQASTQFLSRRRSSCSERAWLESRIDSAAGEFVVERDVASIVRMGGQIPSGALIYPIHVRFSDQDMQMHVNHARYAEFIEDARLTAAAAGGYGTGAWDAPVRLPSA